MMEPRAAPPGPPVYCDWQSVCCKPGWERVLGVLQVVGLREGGMEGGDSSSIGPSVHV